MPTIEYVTLANHVEAINGLLYMQGAGWTDVRPPFDAEGRLGPAHFGIGVSVLVGWNDTNQRFPVELTITHEDGGDPLVRVDGQIEQGRPAGLPPGSDLRSVIGLSADVQFPTPGGYVVRVSLLDEVKSVSFRVLGPPRQPGTGPAAY
ncbi:MAG: hypothetical protein QOE45_3443 [Frankiaceae bacterium]|jgi:hypothetical protein|nr:hypothetical protein [Frankiaceae bacterium]